MNCGRSYYYAKRQAEANAKLDGKSRFLSCDQNGNWWLGKTPLSGPMATPFKEVLSDGTVIDREPEIAQEPKDKAESMAFEARRTGRINFGGEYSFGINDDYETVLARLHSIACDIGGQASGNGFCIKVYPAFETGYWSFYWNDIKKGVTRVSYWTAVQANI